MLPSLSRSDAGGVGWQATCEHGVQRLDNVCYLAVNVCQGIWAESDAIPSVWPAAMAH